MTPPTLTDRQKQLLCLTTYPSKQIAPILGITTQAVRHRLSRIYDALNLPIRTRTAALIAALQQDLIGLDDISQATRTAATITTLQRNIVLDPDDISLLTAKG